MTAPEHLSIDTPEQISLEFPLAGVGSRFLALAFDTLLQVVVALVAVLVVGIVAGIVFGIVGAAGSAISRPWILAVLVLVLFVVNSGYFAVFEAVWRGQTPGKRLVGLRVIDASGSPVSVYAAILRNLLRIVDQLPGIYGAGIVCVLVTSRQQRLGDLAAGTVVVHERTEALAIPDTAAPAANTGASQLTADDLIVMEGFLRRRRDLDPLLRLDTARRIAKHMAGKLGIEAPDDEERLIERLVAEYRSSSRYRG